MIQPRKLAAVDIYLLGPRLIVIEFAVAVVLGTVLGGFILARSHSLGQGLFGAYIFSLGTNYVPMLCHAIRIGSRERAEAEIGTEMDDTRALAAKYRPQTVNLLLPMVTPVAAVWEWLAYKR